MWDIGVSSWIGFAGIGPPLPTHTALEYLADNAHEKNPYSGKSAGGLVVQWAATYEQAEDAHGRPARHHQPHAGPEVARSLPPALEPVRRRLPPWDRGLLQ